MNTSTKSGLASTWTRGAMVLVGIAVIAAIAGFIYWKNYYTPPPKEEAGLEESSLGGEIYTKVSNPVAGELPETTAPTPNPLQNIYKNPFQ